MTLTLYWNTCLNYEEFGSDHISRADVCFVHRPTYVVSLQLGLLVKGTESCCSLKMHVLERKSFYNTLVLRPKLNVYSAPKTRRNWLDFDSNP